MKTAARDSSSLCEISKRACRFLPPCVAVFGIGLLASAVDQARAQAPALLWSTNVEATLFAVDAQTNTYANSGGTVIKLNAAGVPLQTNAICPLPGIARRDTAGNFYFLGRFDGTQDFGGITLVGGWTDFHGWTPGWPTCFAAKYNSAGSLQWATSFGAQGSQNDPTDLLVDDTGACYAGYSTGMSGDIARISVSGSVQWDRLLGNWVQAIKLGGVTSSNCCYLLYHQPFVNIGRANTEGSFTSLDAPYPLVRDQSEGNFGKPVIDDLAQVFAVGRDYQSATPVLRKYASSAGGWGVQVWNTEVTAEALWLLARDPAANVYVAGTNGMLAKFDNDGFFVWSNNFSRQVIAMVVDPSGNRFLSLANGGVARLAADPAAQSPFITAAPQPQTVFSGDPVSLSVVAGGTQPLKYFWRLNGANVLGGTNATFVISNAVPTLSGNYSVVITNSAGAVTSAPALVRVKSVQLYYGSQLLTNGTYAFPSAPTLSVHSAFAGGSVFYTLDGSPPDFTSTFYSGPFMVSQSANVRALGYSSDFSKSEAADAVLIVVLENHTLTASASGGGFVTTNLDTPDLNCLVTPAGGVAWWRAEANAADSLGNHAGLAYGTAAYSNGQVGQAFYFDGVAAHVLIPDAPQLRFSTAMTVETWIKPEENMVQGQGGGTVVARWDQPQFRSQSSYRLRLGNAGHAYFAVSTDGSGGGTSANNTPFCESTTAIPIGSWTHLAGTYDGSYLRVYVNGNLEGQTALSGAIFPGADNVGIGAGVGGLSPGASSDNYKGLIDELTLFSRALAPAEIQAIYQAGASGKCTSASGPFTGGNFVETNIVPVKAFALPGYSFLYWLGDSSGTNPVVYLSMERDKTVQAVFGTTLSTTVAGGGQVQLFPPGGLYPYGTTVRLTGIPDPGNVFGFWGSAATGNTNPLLFTITAPTQTVSSIFGATPVGQAALTVLLNGHGRVNNSPRANAYVLNQSVTLTAVPDAGQSFLNWSGDASGSQNPLAITMTAGKVITANFTARPVLRADRPGLEGLTAAGFRLTLVSDPTSVYQLFGSTNLTDWNYLTTLTNLNGELQFTDPTATNASEKFYKATP